MNVRNSLEQKKRNGPGSPCEGVDELEERRIDLFLFGDRVRDIPITSVKSMIGHCLGAAGGIETAILALTVARGVIPPTINLHDVDPECPGDIVANDARQRRVSCGVSVSLGFGGNDSAVVIRGV